MLYLVSAQFAAAPSQEESVAILERAVVPKYPLVSLRGGAYPA